MPHASGAAHFFCTCPLVSSLSEHQFFFFYPARPFLLVLTDSALFRLLLFRSKPFRGCSPNWALRYHYIQHKYASSSGISISFCSQWSRAVTSVHDLKNLCITWESDPEYIRCLLYVSSVPLSTSRKKGLFLEVMCKVMSASRKRDLFLEVKAVNIKFRLAK